MPDARFAGLTPLFAPRSVAVLGASSDPTRISGRPLAYMKAQGFQGALFPINPNRTEVQGLKASPRYRKRLTSRSSLLPRRLRRTRSPNWPNAA
jgi:hypothetical protein